MKKIFAVVVFLAVGCATMQTVDQSVRTREYKAPKDKVFKAAIVYCSEKAFPITMADKEFGIINTGWKSVDRGTAIVWGDSRFKVNFTTSENVGNTKLTLIVTAQSKGALNQWEDMAVSQGDAKKMYNKIFTGVEKYLPNDAIIHANSPVEKTKKPVPTLMH